MEWVLRSPQLHSTFGNLGFQHGDGYHINENCSAVLESILHNILTEDKYLRTYRRSINFGQNIEKDLIPLLIHAKEEKVIELLIRILVNLTIPIECLLSVDIISKTDFGRHIIFDINSLLKSTKVAYTDHRATKVIIEFLKKNVEVDPQAKLSSEQSTNISNSLLLLRNILHISDDNGVFNSGHNGGTHSVQNQILWNIFSQGFDKILIKLMTTSEASNWGVTMVQIIALLYKDQHVVTLHKLLNQWLDASLSESSEDNESNTSPPDRGSEDSSPMLTSDPTSDSSDTGGSGKSNDEPNSENNGWGNACENNDINNSGNDVFHPPQPVERELDTEEIADVTDNTNSSTRDSNGKRTSCSSIGSQSETSTQYQTSQNMKKSLTSETSDCGYGTQIENQESISTTSNEDEPEKKPVHQKPHNPKQRVNNNKSRSNTLQDRKRKKIVKRGKANIINVQGLSHKTPTDDDISNVLKEFTVDFLLKGYNSLVQTLHNQILTNLQLEIDTSHFFWLVTYFLKFATQIELDFEHICSVLSFDIVSYLTAEGVNLCEQFELAIKRDGNDLNPSIRRLHLLVTAVREFVQAIEVYKKFSHICDEDKQVLVKLEIKMCETEEFCSLLVLLLRHYNPKYHNKQYLQDLVVTNHILLMFMDNVMKSPDYSGPRDISDHIKQFASPELMNQYGLLLEDYADNGEFVNDCIFTIMHHVAGELGSLIALFQPRILKTYTSIWKSEFDICDDWSDLIEYVINTFIKKPKTLHSANNLDVASVDDKLFSKPICSPVTLNAPDKIPDTETPDSDAGNTIKERWTEDELSSLSWNYMQCNTAPDVISEVVKLFKDDGITKSRDSVITELFKQNVLNKDDYDAFLKGESDRNSNALQNNKETIDDEIEKLCQQLHLEGKSKFLYWVQKVLLDTCHAKIYLEKKSTNSQSDIAKYKNDMKILSFEFFKKSYDLPLLSPISYHAVLFNQSVPLVPLNCEQNAICKDLKFVQLLLKLGFHMSVDTGKIFMRIPNFWSTDLLYKVAGKIAPINTDKLKFSVNDLSDSSIASDIALVSTTKDMVSTTQSNINATAVKSASGSGMSVTEVHACKAEGKVVPTLVLSPPASSSFRAHFAPIMSVKHEPAPSTAQHSESEDNNSVCEATFVSSDLTCMCVSDEEDAAADASDTGKRLRVH